MQAVLLSIVVGIVVLVVLGATVASWWLAAVIGIGVILVVSLVEMVILTSGNGSNSA